MCCAYLSCKRWGVSTLREVLSDAWIAFREPSEPNDSLMSVSRHRDTFMAFRIYQVKLERRGRCTLIGRHDYAVVKIVITRATSICLL